MTKLEDFNLVPGETRFKVGSIGEAKRIVKQTFQQTRCEEIMGHWLWSWGAEFLAEAWPCNEGGFWFRVSKKPISPSQWTLGKTRGLDEPPQTFRVFMDP